MADEDWSIKWAFECALSRTTTIVRVSKQEWENGYRWVWVNYVLQTYANFDYAFEAYKLHHPGNTHRQTFDEMRGVWETVRATWVSSSHRDTGLQSSSSSNGQVVCNKWDVADIKRRKSNLLIDTRKTAARTYRGRLQARMDDNDLMLNAVAFGSNKRQDAFRAVMVRDGTTIAANPDGGWTRTSSRNYARLFYDTTAPAPRPSRTMNFTPTDESRSYKWIIKGDGGRGYSTTDVDPGSEVL
jgi:hypothetical protein